MRFLRFTAALVAVFVAVGETRGVPVPPSDDGMSRLHVTVEPHRLELSFDFDQSAARKMKAESSRALAAFIEDNVHLEINGIALNPGVVRSIDDAVSKTPRVTFVRDSAETVKTIGISMELFDVLGDRHRVEAVFEQDGRKYETFFTVFETDYLYDTGWDAPQVSWRLAWRQGIESVWKSRTLLASIVFCFLALRFAPINRRPVAVYRLLLVSGLLALWGVRNVPPSDVAEPMAWRMGQLVGLLIASVVASPLLFIPRRRS